MPELDEMRRKALLDAEHWFSLVGKKLGVAGSLGIAEIELNSNVTSSKTVQNKSKHDQHQVVLPVEKRFKPKFGPAEVESGCIQYAAVLITHAIHPNHFYVQIEDQDLPLYHQMMDDLQQEFREATKRSRSYHPSPLSGK